MRLHLITYGSNKFVPAHFRPVSNCKSGWVKPDGGMWASPIGSDFGWKEWCEREEFSLGRLKYSFTFWYESNYILIIDSKDDLKKMIWKKLPVYSMQYPDFEKMSKKFDAICLTRKGEAETRHLHEKNLYGWDCECVFIMNPKGIEPDDHIN
jgi:hypothetical protein